MLLHTWNALIHMDVYKFSKFDFIVISLRMLQYNCLCNEVFIFHTITLVISIKKKNAKTHQKNSKLPHYSNFDRKDF
jgi:hypothetical protein